METGATRIEVVRNDNPFDHVPAASSEELLAGVDMLVNAGEYAVLRPLRRDLVRPEDAVA